MYDAIYLSASLNKTFPSFPPPIQIIWGAMLCRGVAGLYFIPPNWTQVHRIAQRETKTSHARPRQHDLLRSKEVTESEEKQDLCAGMAQEQPRSRSNRESVNYCDR